MPKLPRRPTRLKRLAVKRRLSYVAQWNADAARQQRDLEHYADRWNAEARSAGNSNA